MNNVDSGQQRKSNYSYDSYNESDKESSLPGESTANRDNGNVDEADYDRYEYEGAETPDQEANIRSKTSCCKKGGLSH